MLIFVAILFASLLKFSAIGCVKKIAEHVLDKMIYNGIIRMLLESCIYIFLGSFLNFKYGISYDFHAIMNIFVSVGFTLLMFLFAINCFVMIKRNANALDSENCKKFHELTKELREDPMNFQIYFCLIFMLRRFLLCALVVFIEGAMVQISASLVVNTFYVLWLVAA